MWWRKLIGFLKGNHANRTGDDTASGQHDERCGVHSFAAQREQALSDQRGIRMLADACAAERGRDTGTLPEDPVQRESAILIAAARQTGCHLDIHAIPGVHYTIRSGESEVYWNAADRCYYKIKNPFAKLHLKQHAAIEVLYEHIVHNILFPNCRLEFLGVTEELGEARLVFRQKAVLADKRPTEARIARDLAELGLLPEDRYAFGNAALFVTDVGENGDNVLLGDNDDLYFIDPIIGFKKPAEEVIAFLVGGAA